MTIISNVADLAFQNKSLHGVSRTFALTIPQLPPALRDVVGNAYLLCRIADTIEDAPCLSASLKRTFVQQFIRVVEGEELPQKFVRDIVPCLSANISASEYELIKGCSSVIRITRVFSATQQASLARCVRIMALGMADFQMTLTGKGLDSLKTLDRYCYHVAGVVGEMLTELFCEYSPAIDRYRKSLMGLAVSFGQGLQMTNILKDAHDDLRRGVCWLPRDVFVHLGVELHEGSTKADCERYRHGLHYLIGITHAHLANALAYTLLLPKNEPGLRRFCLWALGMAALTLRRIHSHPPFSSTDKIKISRHAVKATMWVTSLSVSNDWLLKRLFNLAVSGMPLESLEGENKEHASGRGGFEQ